MRLSYLSASLLFFACSQTSQTETKITSVNDSTVSQTDIDTLIVVGRETKHHAADTTSELVLKENSVQMLNKSVMEFPITENYSKNSSENNFPIIKSDQITEVVALKEQYNLNNLDETPHFIPQNQLINYIKTHLIYPDSLNEKAGTYKEAQIIFIVNADGHISDVAIHRSSGLKALDDAAIKVIKNMPAWQPGISNGKAVPTNLSMPVRFNF